VQIALVYDAVYPFVAGGVERRNYAVAEVLRREHGVALYGFRYWDENGDACLPGCRYVAVGAPVPLYHANGRRRILEAITFGGRLFGALLRSREEVWDVANLPFFSVPAAWLASRLLRRTLVVSWYEYWGEYWYRYLGWRGIFGRCVEKLALACSPHIIAISQITRRRLIAAGYPSERITIVPGGVDLESIATAPPADQTHDLICVGRLISHKRVHLAIESLEVLRRTHPTATLAIVGDGPERQRLEQRVAELGLEPAVHFYGKLPAAEQVYGLMKSSRVLVAPSEREGFGISIVEAWGCGLPAIVCPGDENAMTELVDEPIKGRVALAEPSTIAAACSELLGEPRDAYQEQLAEAAAGYGWQRIAARLEKAYQSLTQEQV
jgi:glycosyltransferase involved in cell wall biosynthesis